MAKGHSGVWVLTWGAVDTFLLQLWEVLQEEAQGIVCCDALELEAVHVGLWGQPEHDAHPSNAQGGLALPSPDWHHSLTSGLLSALQPSRHL